jgi:hypothetical protein
LPFVAGYRWDIQLTMAASLSRQFGLSHTKMQPKQDDSKGVYDENQPVSQQAATGLYRR